MNDSRKPYWFVSLLTTRILVISLVIIALLLRFTFLWVSLRHLPVTSDEASLALLAKTIFQGELPLLFIGQPYQFPIESYLMAPFIEWLPRNTIGVRYQMFILGLVSLAGFYAIIKLSFPREKRWPAALLILFPSAYFLMLTSAYAMPQYSVALLLAWLSIFAALFARQSRYSTIWYFLAGLGCGLSLSNHLLTLTVSIGIFILVIGTGSFKNAVKNGLIMAAGCSIGILPYLLAILKIPGAYGNIPQQLSFASALSRLWNPSLSETLAGAMGVNPVLFPDFMEQLNWPGELRSVFAGLYIIIFTFLAIGRIGIFIQTLRRQTWPTFELVDAALLTSIATIWVFSTHATDIHAYRYMLPAVWCFPFLIGHLFQTPCHFVKTLTGTIAILLAVFNFTVSCAVIDRWREPGKIEQYADTPKLDKLMDELTKRGIKHCYASFWLAYRISYASDEKIVCSLPYNERFLYWPIPYKAEVDRQKDAVYILTQTFEARLSAYLFLHHLKGYGVTAHSFRVGPFQIFHQFRLSGTQEIPNYTLTANEYTVQSPESDQKELTKLKDGDLDTVWSSNERRHRGQRIILQLPETKRVASLTLFYPPKEPLDPYTIKIRGKKDQQWIRLAGPVNTVKEKLYFVNSHPVYLGCSQQFRFSPTPLTALEVEIVDPGEHQKWKLADIELNTIKAD